MKAELVDSRTCVDQAGQREALLQALRTSVNRLPRLERQLVALHYGAGLSQVDMATKLSIPRRAVAFKIEEALRRLRQRLSQAGFSSAGSSLIARTLHEAICSGHECPPGLFEKVMARIAQAETQGIQSVPRRAAPAPSNRGLVWTGWLLLAGFLGTAFRWIAGEVSGS